MVKQEATPQEAASESTRCFASGAPTMAARTFRWLNPGPEWPLPPPQVGSTVTVSHQRTFIHVRFIKTWLSVVVLLATWLSGGRVVPLLQTADGIESEFASDVDATQSMSPNVTDWSRLFVLRWNFWFVSAINLSQHQFEKKKKYAGIFSIWLTW